MRLKSSRKKKMVGIVACHVQYTLTNFIFTDNIFITITNIFTAYRGWKWIFLFVAKIHIIMLFILFRLKV